MKHSTLAMKLSSTEKILMVGSVARYDSEIQKNSYLFILIIFYWNVFQAMNDLSGMDIVPEPKIIIAALHACRRINDFALATRFIETVKDKCGNRVNEIYPYILQEIRPTLEELGLNTPEELGFDQPELALKSVYDM